MKVAYFVSRFPTLSETFILREMNALRKHEGLELELFSLFPAPRTAIHPAAAWWLPSLHRPSAVRAMIGLGFWFTRRPVRLLSSLALVAASHWRKPALFVRAVVTVPLAAGHARTLRGSGVAHIHAHFATYPTLAAWLSNRLTGIPYSFTVHAYDLYVDQTFLGRKVADARFVVTISRYNAGLLSVYGPQDRIHVVHCGVVPTAYRFRPRRPPSDGPVQVLCVASLVEHKGHRVLLEALAGADADLQRIAVKLVGEGRLRRDLERLIEELRLAGRVRFLGGLTEPEVIAALDRADVFILPSLVTPDGLMEGVPVALMEALASGTPVVATRLPGITELITDGITGVLAEPGNVSSLRAALTRVISQSDAGLDPEAGRRLVEAEFNVALSARKLAELFNSYSGRRARR